MRRRHGLSLAEVAERAGVDMSYISRLERDALQNAKPKPETIDKVLEAIGITAAERDAVYHIEQSPLTRQEIDDQVHRVAAILEDSPEPVEMSDDRWHVHYHNRAARAVLGLTASEYRAAAGTHMLHAAIDPANPLYNRIPGEDRQAVFAMRCRMFQVAFASQEFDDWYSRVVARIYDFPWAVSVWENPEWEGHSLVLERQDLTILNPVSGYMRLRFQLNRLIAHPRFLLADWNLLNTVSAIQLAVLRTRPEYSYSYETSLAAGAWARQSYDAITLY